MVFYEHCAILFSMSRLGGLSMEEMMSGKGRKRKHRERQCFWAGKHKVFGKETQAPPSSPADFLLPPHQSPSWAHVFLLFFLLLSILGRPSHLKMPTPLQPLRGPPWQDSAAHQEESGEQATSLRWVEARRELPLWFFASTFKQEKFGGEGLLPCNTLHSQVSGEWGQLPLLGMDVETGNDWGKLGGSWLEFLYAFPPSCVPALTDRQSIAKPHLPLSPAAKRDLVSPSVVSTMQCTNTLLAIFFSDPCVSQLLLTESLVLLPPLPRHHFFTACHFVRLSRAFHCQRKQQHDTEGWGLQCKQWRTERHWWLVESVGIHVMPTPTPFALFPRFSSYDSRALPHIFQKAIHTFWCS